tara:strand:+ start:1051 stop:1395 length:345 start_codon:yes stop_codon:yes gene_type:complete
VSAPNASCALRHRPPFDPSCPEASTLTTRDGRPQAHFAGYGTVKDAVIMLDRVTNRSRGFGFVIFVDPASVTAVLDEQQYHEIGGRKVEVKPALPKELVEKGVSPACFLGIPGT